MMFYRASHQRAWMRLIDLSLTLVIFQIFLYLYSWTTESHSTSLLMSANMCRLIVKMLNADTSASETSLLPTTSPPADNICGLMDLRPIVRYMMHISMQLIGPKKGLNKNVAKGPIVRL